MAKAILCFLILSLSIMVQASPTALTYQGRIVKSDGSPLQSSNVSFVFEITSSNGSCVLYREQVNGVNLVNSNGVFDVKIGASHSYPADSTFTINKSFNNSMALTCEGGVVYNPGVQDDRRLRVQFYDGTAWRQITPDSVIRSVPYAAFADAANKLGVYGSSDFLLKTSVNDNSNCSGGSFLTWDAGSQSFGCEVATGGGGGGGGGLSAVTSTTSHLMVANGATAPALTINVGTVAGSVAAGNDPRFSDARPPLGPAAGDLTGDYPSPTVIKINGYGIDFASPPNANQVLTFDGTNWTAQNLPAGNAGTMTSVTAGAGLTGGTITTAGTIGLGTELSGLNSVAGTGYILRTSPGTYGATSGSTASTPNTLVLRDSDGVSDFRGLSLSDGTSGLVTLQTSLLSAMYSLRFPPAQGGANQVMVNDGSGLLSWQDIPSVPASACGVGSVLTYNGASFVCVADQVGSAGGGLTSLNSETASTQSLAVGTTGTNPTWSSTAGVHTLNIPFARDPLVMAGLLSKEEFDIFSAKQDSLGFSPLNPSSNLSDLTDPAAARANLNLGSAATRDVPSSGNASATQVVLGDDTRLSNARTPIGTAGGDLGGSYPDPVISKIQGVDVDLSTPPTSGQVLSFDGSRWMASDLPSSSAITSLDTGPGLTGGPISGSGTIALGGPLLGLHNIASNGYIQRTGAGTYSTTTGSTTSSANTLVVRDGSGVGAFSGVSMTGGSGFVTLTAPAVATTYSLTFPNSQGGADQVLVNNGSGALAWANVPSAPASACGAGNVLTYDGTSFTCVPDQVGSAGGGITTLNGQTGSSQSLSTGTTGTAPAFVSSSSVHTLNIPFARNASVTGGLISKAEFDLFYDKQDKLNFTPLRPSNNLNELTDFAVARTNLGLGTAAVLNTGTTSGTLPVIGTGNKLAASLIPNLAGSTVTYTPSGNITATTVQGAIAELDSEKVSKTGDTMTGVLALPAGTAAVPSLSFSTDLDTGLYSPGANQLAISTGGTVAASFDVNGNINLIGNIGVKSAAPNAGIAINSSLTASANADRYGVYSTLQLDDTAPLSAARSAFGARNEVVSSLSDANRGEFNSVLYGSYNRARAGSSTTTPGAATSLYGSYNQALNQSTSTTTVANSYGSYNLSQNVAASTVTNAYGSYSYALQNNATGTTTNAFGYRSQVTNTAGTIEKAYGFYAAFTGTIDQKYGIYTTGEHSNYFSGSVGVGTASPSSKLHVAGGVQIGNDTATCDTSKAGTLRFASSTVSFCNGSSWVAFSATVGTVTSVATGAGLTGGPITGAGTLSVATDGITSAMIANGTIATVDIADNAVTTAKIATGAVTATELASNAVTTVKIADGAVNNAKLAANSVTSAEIVNATIVAADLADNAVTTAKINTGAVTATELASNAVTTVKIADSAVTNAKLAANSVTSAEIVNATIVAADLADNAVTSAKIATSAVTATELASNAVTTAKIADSAVTNAKLAANSVTSAEIVNGTIVASDLATSVLNRMWSGNDTDVWYTTGDVGIGTSAPAYKLHVNGDIGAKSFLYTSDARLKTDVHTLDHSLDKVLQLRGVSFAWKEDGTRDLGFIAQEVEAVIPDAVVTRNNEEGLPTKSVKYANLVGLVVQSIKELFQKVVLSESRIETLEKENQELRDVVRDLHQRVLQLENRAPAAVGN